MRTTPATDDRKIVLPASKLEGLISGARDLSPVSGLTHNHYKYPARFSPKFVRAALEAFSEPGDLVLDPFVGGGTTAVEALANGRSCIGVDISALATFVANTKTLLLSEDELSQVQAWSMAAVAAVNMSRWSVDFAIGDHEGYYRNLEGQRFWRMRKAVEQALATTLVLRGHAEQLARCIVLRTAQWALDGRSKLPSVEEFRRVLAQTAKSMIEGSRAFRVAASSHASDATGMFLTRSAAGLEHERRVTDAGAPKLVLTSPPYPGIHVLYHRWQVDGRRETPAPFLIANQLDGSGESYYTLGHRRNPGLRTYWKSLSGVLRSTAAISDLNTIFVQVVAFSEPDWQLPRYLEVCSDAGLCEATLDGFEGPDGRLWRSVPNRRWYADQKGSIPASHEVVLFHRLEATPPMQLPPQHRRSETQVDHQVV